MSDGTISETSQSVEFQCARCQRSDQPRLERPPMPGALGATLVERICRPCWDEWQNMEVMVINELRLNFMDPESQTVLAGHMREFLQLPAASSEKA